jgi:hypothetical protein
MLRGALSTIAVGIAVLSVFSVACSAAYAQDINLTGKWSCDDTGTYYVRQIGNKVWWMGKSKEGGKEWSNVFRGEIKGKQIIGEWVDVPRGESMGSGTLHLEMHLRNGNVVEIRKAKQIGDEFGGGVWKR